MRPTRSAVLAWSLAALALGLTIAGITLSPTDPAQINNPLALANALLSAGFSVAFGLMSAVIVARQPRNTIGWLMMIVALTLALQFFLVGYQDAFIPDVSVQTLPNVLITWYNQWAWWGLMGPLLLISVLFPTGRPLTPRWRWVIGLIGVCFLIFFLVTALQGSWETSVEGVSLVNPFGLADFEFENFVPLWALVMLAAVALSVSAIFVRYRRASAVEREQIKWLWYAFAFVLVTFFISFIFQNSDAAGAIFSIAVLTVPVAIGIAILRYRLWDIDVIIRRTLVYTALTVLLALAYFGSVLVLQSGFQAVTGEGQSALVTVISTLFIAALFVPVRGRVQRAIDQRFYRRKYDTARTLAAFGTQARDEVGLDRLSGDLVQVVEDTMQPAHVTLWVRGQPDR